MMRLVLFLGMFVMAGCSTSYNFLQPEILIPEKFSQKDSVSELLKDKKVQDWWKQFDNEVLVYLIKKAKENSPSIESAIVNIKMAEGILKTTEAKTIPNLNLSVNLEKDNINSINYNYLTLGLQTSWEIDFLGKNELIKKANRLQLQNSRILLYSANTLIETEVARNYFNYKFCVDSLNVLKEDFEARKKQNEITNLRIKAGFEAPASIYQNNASLSQSQSNILAQESQCKIIVQSLLALTAIKEPEMEELLSKEISVSHSLSLYVPLTIPGDLIKQRPDIINSFNNMKIIAYNLQKIKLDAYPSMSITGNISRIVSNFNSTITDGNTWSIGPLVINLPILDGGVRVAKEKNVESQYVQAQKQFASDLRNAIKEVEVALINLQVSDSRLNLIDKSVSNYKKAYNATFEKYKVGLIGLYELENARLNLLNEMNARTNTEFQRMNSWIDLYKAVGGEFNNVH